jgi:Lon protease-like protein
MTREDGMLPIFPLDLVLFPGQPLPLHIFEPRYKEMIGHCLAEKTPFGIVRAKENTISEIGCTAEIIALTKRYDDGRMDIQTAGRRRFEVMQINEDQDFLRAEVVYQEDEPGLGSSEQVQRVLGLHTEVVHMLGPNDSYEPPDSADPQLSYELAASIPIDLDFKQTLLATRSESERLTMLIDFYEQVIPKLKRAAKIREKAGGNGHVL